jgi:hypothetical protein
MCENLIEPLDAAYSAVSARMTIGVRPVAPVSFQCSSCLIQRDQPAPAARSIFTTNVSASVWLSGIAFVRHVAKSDRRNDTGRRLIIKMDIEGGEGTHCSRPPTSCWRRSTDHNGDAWLLTIEDC